MFESIGNHLWQSTLFAAGAALLCLAMHRNRAQVRYGLWLVASLKFLVPFAMLTAIGGQIQWPAPLPAPSADISLTLDALGQPFSADTDLGLAAGARLGSELILAPVAAGVWLAGAVTLLVVWWARWRRVAAVMRTAARLSSGREFNVLERVARSTGARPAPPLLGCDASLEPGVVGIVRPVLLWPRSMSEHLTDDQIEAIFTHELAHLRRRDNLTAALHQTVQTIFWFHPVVWWLGARLLDERERACDQEVTRLGNRPEVYAESIVKTCRLCVESPFACVSGVTGSELGKRIERIMTNRQAHPLTAWRKLGLMVTGLAAIGLPVAAGVLLKAPVVRAQIRTITDATPRFDVVSVRRNVSGQSGGGSRSLPDGSFTATNLPVRRLILNAYRLQGAQIVGAPSWIDEERYDIEAKPVEPATPEQTQSMIRALLADRLGMRAHGETREMPVYALVPVRADGRLGPGLTSTPPEDCARQPAAPVGPGNRPPCGAIQFGPGQLIARGATMDQFATMLMNITPVTGINRIVVDRTGLTGNFGFELRFMPVGRGGGPAASAGDPAGERPSFFTALQEEFGLKLDPRRAPVEVLVIDSIERPSEN